MVDFSLWRSLSLYTVQISPKQLLKMLMVPDCLWMNLREGIWYQWYSYAKQEEIKCLSLNVNGLDIQSRVLK